MLPFTDAEKRLTEFIANKGPRRVPVDPCAVIGDPFWEICQAAEREHADLIVMGSHGRTGLAHVLLGSVAERVVRHAPYPVLVARLPRSATQVLVIFIIRTRRNPLRSRPSPWLMVTSLAVVAVVIVLPVTPVGVHLGFVPPPPAFFLILAGMVAVYLLAVEGVKQWFYQHLS